jgi:hypothetical protein
MQIVWDTIKRPKLNLWVEVEVIPDKDIENIFSKMVAENFPNLEKDMVIQV